MEKFNPFPLEDVLKILPVLALFVTGTVVLIIDLFLRSWNSPGPSSTAFKSNKWLLWALSILGTGFACLFAFQGFSSGEASSTAFSGAIRFDLFSNAITCIILLGTMLTVVTTVGYLRRNDMEHGEFYALLFYAAGSMVLLAESNNLILVFLSLETFSLAVYVLAAYTRDAQRSVEGALKYFVLGSVSSGFLLLGLVFLFGATGSIRLDVIGEAIATGQNIDLSLFLAGLGLSLVGFGFKVGAFPFHSWIPDAYEGAPTLVTGFMSVTVKAAAVAALTRFALVLTNVENIPRAQAYLTETIWWLALGTMIFGNLVALVQSSVKRMLAYSAISHTGYILIGLVAALESNSPARGAPIVFYLLPYTLMTFGAFAILSGLGRESTEDETFDSFRGMSKSNPFLAFVMLLFMVSLAGIPPTAGFWGKFYLFQEAVIAGHWPLALIGILTSIISMYYYLRLVIVMYMQPSGDESRWSGAFNCSWGAGLVAAVAAAGIVAIGLLPGRLLEISVDSIKSVLEIASP